jgi:phosphoglycerate-specific signal transduction histidine kinase
MTRVMTVGELMASVAHQLNQPLGAMAAHGAAGARERSCGASGPWSFRRSRYTPP